MWGRSATCARPRGCPGLPPLSRANAAVGRLPIGRSLSSCPTKPLPIRVPARFFMGFRGPKAHSNRVGRQPTGFEVDCAGVIMDVDRRFFLLGSAIAAQAFQPERPVNTAVIGTGNRGSFLLQGVLRQPNAKVLALCDIKPDRLDKAASAAARDNPATYADWRRIIDRKDVDAVFIGTPPYLHSEMAIAALQAGKHVYCEKPVGITAAPVRGLRDAA